MTSPIDEDFGIDLASYANEEAENFENEAIDLEEYAQSEEAQKATWGDLAKDIVIQPALGYLKAFTWPADLVKYGMVKSALGDIDDIAETYRRQGIDFNQSDFIKSVEENYEFIPTQEAAEKKFTKSTGIELEPKSELGKRVNQFFKLFAIAKGSGAPFKSAAIGTGTTEALKQVGVGEEKAELAGDLLSGFGSIKKSSRQLPQEAQELEQIAIKNKLPFPEYLTRDKAGLANAKITEARKAALQKQLGMDSEEALQKIIENKLPISKLKNQGVDIEALKNDAYDKVSNLVKQNNSPFNPSSTISDINNEILRIKNIAPSLSSDSKKSIEILERFRDDLEKNPANLEKIVNQIRENNREVSSIYRKPEFSGREDAVKNTYAFLNDSLRNSVEAQGGKPVREAMRVADSLNTEFKRLEHVENLIEKSFQGGEYNPKKLNQLLNSREGQIVRRELGDTAINELRDIAKYGEAAVKATNQLAKSSKYSGELAAWGPLAGLLLAKIPKTAGILLAAKPAADHVRGYLMTNPATRTIYRDILKNAAEGSFKNMQPDFSKLEKVISDQYGSVDNFLESIYNDLEVVEDFD